MRCPIQSRDNAEILLAYCDRKLDPEAMSLLDRHVSDCPACQEVLAGQRAVWSALESWDAAEISPDFNRKLWRRIDNGEAAGWWKSMFQVTLPFSLRPAMPVAAACVILAAGILLRTPGSLPSQPLAESVDIEQVERTLEDMDMLRELSAPARADDGKAGRSL